MTKILLVEDDKSLREIYGVRLLAEGYDIVSAGDGEEALAMAIKERPDLIVSDVMMPKISGFDMLDILRSTTETRNIKVIMMTALSSEDQRRRGEALGADRYLVKSQVGIEDVVRTVHDVLQDGHLTVEQRTAQKQAVTTNIQQNNPVQQNNFTAAPSAPVQPMAQAASTQPLQAPVRAAAPSLAQFERERPAPAGFVNQQPQPMPDTTVRPIQPVSRPATANSPVQTPTPTAQPTTVNTPAPRSIEAPTHPISDFVNQPHTVLSPVQQETVQSVAGERVVQPLEPLNRTDEENLASQINDILNSGNGETFSNSNMQQPPFGAQ